MAFRFILKNTKTDKTKTFELKSEGEFTVGRGEKCDIRVADKKASSTHFKFVIRNKEVQVIDLESRNGISVNGFRVTGSRFYVDARLEFGVYTIEYDKGALSPSETIANTSKRKIGGKKDVTLVLTDKSLHIQRDVIMNTIVKEKTRLFKRDDVSMLNIKKNLKKK